MFGVTLWEMFTHGQEPWLGLNGSQVQAHTHISNFFYLVQIHEFKKSNPSINYKTVAASPNCINSADNNQYSAFVCLFSDPPQGGRGGREAV